ncbi:rhomboid family intramembrane serine protease [Myxococcota bacterium]|nr:rhomboid family intramembrane serine protease [Myxococcota bacterium]
MYEANAGPRDTFALHGKRAIQLQADGLAHPRSARSRSPVFTAYEDLTHLACSRRSLWIGTRSSTYVIPRALFADPEAPEALIRAILSLLSSRPGGAAQLSRMAQVESVARTPSRALATWVFAASCLVVYGLQIFLGDRIWNVGYMSLPLVREGDLWRVVTGNLLHGVPAFPVHLAFNLIALLALGNLVERVLGSARTACLMGASGIASMAAGGLASANALVGSSGVVFGLAGACSWLEFRHAHQLPAWLRIPRQSMYLFLILNLLVMLLIPFVSGGAHIGGFLAGALMCAALTRSEARLDGHSSGVRGLASATMALLALAVGTAGFEAYGRPHFDSRFNVRLAQLPGASPSDLNNRAWAIAIDPEASTEDREAALLLAERAVQDTERSTPQILDTLAVIQFQLGWRELAVATILEAINQAPSDPYYREQLRRFTTTRSPDRDLFLNPAPNPRSWEEPGLPARVI